MENYRANLGGPTLRRENRKESEGGNYQEIIQGVSRD